MLINLELDTVVENRNNTRTGLKHMTGTLEYMAIEVLRLGFSGARLDLKHTYRHDLKSFFYVFLAMCVHHGWPEGRKPTKDPLRSWYVGDYKDMALAKRGAMERGGFKSMRTEVSPQFEGIRDLAWNLRDLLFLRGELSTGTPVGDEFILYDQMISAFDEALASCDSREIHWKP